jgi:uncharacterized BrkB/YihY/UPF0761 family membrane protein
MEKPRKFIEVTKTRTFSAFGVLMVGRAVIPVYIIINTFLIVTALLVITAFATQNVAFLFAAGVPLGLIGLFFVFWLFAAIAIKFRDDILKAKRQIEGGNY